MFRLFAKWTTVTLILMLVLLVPAPVLAAEMRGGQTVNIPKGTVIEGDLYIGANTIEIEGTVNGDVFAAAQMITISGVVKGGVSAAGQNLTISGEVERGARLAGQNISVSGTVSRDLVALGASVSLTSAARIGGDLFVSAGSARILCQVDGNVKGSTQDITIGGDVKGDVNVQVSTLTLTPDANVQGKLTYTSKKEATIESGAKTGQITRVEPPAREPRKARPEFGIMGKIIGYLMALLTGIVLILIFPEKAKSVTDAIKLSPGSTLGWGAVVFFLTPLAAVAMLITVIGIPLGVATFFLYGIFIYLSQIVIGIFAGRWLLSYLKGGESKGALIGALALGLLVLLLLRMVPVLGFFIGLASVLFGLGAVFISVRAGLSTKGQTAPVTT